MDNLPCICEGALRYRMRVIIAGGRDFNNYPFLVKECDKILHDIKDDILIISGVAEGADKLGLKYAIEKQYQCIKCPAKWYINGKIDRGAGYKRNIVMADMANMLIAFWDGESKGTKHMIETAKAKGLKVEVIRY